MVRSEIHSAREINNRDMLIIILQYELLTVPKRVHVTMSTSLRVNKQLYNVTYIHVSLIEASLIPLAPI